MRPKSSSSSSRPFRPVSDTKPDADPPFIKERIEAIFSAVEPERARICSMTAIALSVSPFSLISSLTASSPILSSLSIATVMSTTLSGKPQTSAKPVRTLRLLILTSTRTSSRAKTLSTIWTSSNSFSWELEPMTSTSHW